MIAVPIVAVALAVSGVVFVVLVLIGAHREAPWTALDDQPPTPLAGFARAVLGVYVRKNTDHQPTEITEITELIQGRR